MCPTESRNTELRNQVAQRLRTLRHWPFVRHRLPRDTEPRKLAELRVCEATLEGLVRSTVIGFDALQSQPDTSVDFVEVCESSATSASPTNLPAFKPLSEVIARAEARGLNLDAVTVHQETHKVPYEDWDEEVLIVCDRVPVPDWRYAQAIDAVWHEHQQSLLAEEKDREDYATYLRLHQRFARQAGHAR